MEKSNMQLNKMEKNIYDLESRFEGEPLVLGFEPSKAKCKNGSFNENIITTSDRILNQDAPFLKEGLVKAVGDTETSTWQVVSDEGGAMHNQTAPNPLTYYAAGIVSSLLTQLERGVQILDLNVENIKVEGKVFFRWNNAFTDNWLGFTDKVITNIIIKSSETPEKIKELKEFAVRAWSIGEALKNKTNVDAEILLNGKYWKNKGAKLGKVGNSIAKENGFTLLNVTKPIKAQTFEVEEDLAVEMGNFPNPFEFVEVATAESIKDKDRYFIHKIKGKSLTQNYETWELYTDDSIGYKNIQKAPSSRELFTIGTSLCLMSQLTANQFYFNKKGIEIEDFRVEHQFNYQQEDFMTPKMVGHVDDVITRIFIKSKATDDILMKYGKQSLACCFAGDGVKNETEILTDVYLDGQLLK
jgi:uncharacterized OsmC-like protein